MTGNIPVIHRLSIHDLLAWLGICTPGLRDIRSWTGELVDLLGGCGLARNSRVHPMDMNDRRLFATEDFYAYLLAIISVPSFVFIVVPAFMES